MAGRSLNKPTSNDTTTQKFFEKDDTPPSSQNSLPTNSPLLSQNEREIIIRKEVESRLNKLIQDENARAENNEKAREVIATAEDLKVVFADNDREVISPSGEYYKSPRNSEVSLSAKKKVPIKKGNTLSRKRQAAHVNSPGKKSKITKKSPKKGSGNSPVKTRSNISEIEKLLRKPHCLICEGGEGIFMRCRLCEYRFHPACIQIQPPYKQSRHGWRCFDCTCCAHCQSYIDDHENVKCNRCGRGFHGRCKPPGTVPWYPFKYWRCGDCADRAKSSEEIRFFGVKKIGEKNVSPNIKRSKHPLVKKKKITPLKAIIFDNSTLQKVHTLRNLSTMTVKVPLEEPNTVVVVPAKVEPEISEIESQRQAARKAVNEAVVIKMSELALEEAEIPTKEVVEQSLKLTERCNEVMIDSDTSLLLPCQQVWPNVGFDENEENEFFNSLDKKKRRSGSKSAASSPNRKVKKRKETTSISSKQKSDHGKQMYQYLSQFSLKDILNRYAEAKQNALTIMKAEKDLTDEWISQLNYDKNVSQYLHIGPEYIIPVKKCLPVFDPTMKKAPLIFVCPKCFELNLSPLKFCLHLNICKYSNPPGEEIYREELTLPNGKKQTISFFEVHGAFDIDYCRRMCVVASGLLPAKAVTREVELFTFYVLTEFHSEYGFVPAGFFSKELKPSQNNNLSCLLVFNHYRAAGYGKLLVDLSYHLSKRERKFGSPEHPLSDDGLHLYRSYWTARIFEYIRQHRHEKKISLEDISKETYIYIDDIVSTLIECRMIKLLEGQKVIIDCTKPWFSDVRLIRRRAIKPELLEWEPKHEPGEEHKEYYACSSGEDD